MREQKRTTAMKFATKSSTKLKKIITFLLKFVFYKIFDFELGCREAATPNATD